MPSDKAMQLTKAQELTIKIAHECMLFHELRMGATVGLNFNKAEKLIVEYTAEALSDTMRVVEKAEKALLDAQGGLDYVRRNHGDLYGVGFDRCEEGSRNALAATAKLKEESK